ncbi:hypothetical protein M0657_007297 [Pyricularia oryzae]|nr:hypothetical protein M0657_007297 [Pyricularia oryzae]KAI7924952.1 hypothetical protein M9X92_003528 [Pyricularia oryzae]
MANITPRTIVAPAAAFTMACLLFTSSCPALYIFSGIKSASSNWADRISRYTRSSIRQAKANAKTNRDAQIRNRPSYPEEPAPPEK